MDKKVLYALTSKIFSTLKKMGIKPKIGVTTDIQRLPGLNSFNSDLSKLTEARPESLKKLIATDADFLAKAEPEELRQYYNNLEYLQATYPEIFSKAEVVTESKTGLKTLVDDINEKLKGKKSMESVDLKTGEVTTFKEPVMTAESKSRKLTKDEIADYEERIGRDSEDWMLEGTVKEAEEALKRSKAEEAYYRGQYLTGKLDPAAGEQTQARMKFLQKKLEEAEMTKDRRLISPREIEELNELEKIFSKDKSVWKKGDVITEENFGSSPFAPSQETLDNLEKARKMSSEMSLEQRMNMVLNQYDKSMFVKNEQGMVDVTNPQNIERMALLLKKDHPELYNEIFNLTEDLNQKQQLLDFDITGRKPNAKGGLIKNVSYKSMMSDLDRTLKKGLGTMFKRKR